MSGAGVYGHGVVATFARENSPEDIETYGGFIGEIEAGDRIYSWENDYGIRAIGIALEDGESDPVPSEHRLFYAASDARHEFHAPVRWRAVLDREDAITPDEVQQITDHPVWARGAHVELSDDHYPELLWDLATGRSSR